MRIIIIKWMGVAVNFLQTKVGSSMIITRHQSINKWLNKYWVAISPVLVAIPLVLLAILNSPVANA